MSTTPRGHSREIHPLVPVMRDAGHDVTQEIVPGGHFDLVLIPPGDSGQPEPAVEAILDPVGGAAS
jgi:hypothetical protein